MNRNFSYDEQHRRRIELCRKVLQNCRNELYSYFPHLDAVFASVLYQADEQIETIGTDGCLIYYNISFLMRQYVQDAPSVRRGYLHMLLHCLYLHIFPKEGIDRQRWDLACDIAVEQIIEKEEISGLCIEYDPVREKVFDWLGARSLAAQEIYAMLESGAFPFEEDELKQVFSFDEHCVWDAFVQEEQREGLRKKWEKIFSYTGRNKRASSRRRGAQKGTQEETAGEICESRYDYRHFLRQFCVMGEEVELDSESFDYIFYCYGLQHYKDMPLLEPLEYKEVHRLEELVIAIDTSGSCSCEDVRQFLGETYAILSRRENFFQKMKVYILQCDSFIQEAVLIRSKEEWMEYSRKITIQGRGGTDFCPVFRYIEEKKRAKELQKLKGLIYFTDGDGIYPKEKPDYETAFVFLRKTDKMELAPDWAKTLVVQ